MSGWMLCLDGIGFQLAPHLSETQEDLGELIHAVQDHIKKDARWAPLIQEAQSQGWKLNVNTNPEHNPPDLSVLLGVELLPGRYLCDGETVLIPDAPRSLPDPSGDLVTQIQAVIADYGTVTQKVKGLLLYGFS